MATSTSYGNFNKFFDSFDPDSEDIDSYLERLEQYCVINKITDEKRVVAMLIANMGSKM